MRPILYEVDELRRLFTTHVVATMPGIKRVLGTTCSKTAQRKMKQLSCQSSYSHGGSYYTLCELARFDELGLWSYGDVHFSKLGSLMETLTHFVGKSEGGFFAGELEQLLRVGVKMALSRLMAKGDVSREKIGNRYLYCSSDPAVRRQQVLSRNLMESAEQPISDAARAAIIIFWSILDEKERRLYAGVEAIKYGYGGDRFIAQLLGMHPKTVARGRKELLSGEVEKNRVRAAGGGRKPVEKKRPRSSRESKS